MEVARSRHPKYDWRFESRPEAFVAHRHGFRLCRIEHQATDIVDLWVDANEAFAAEEHNNGVAEVA